LKEGGRDLEEGGFCGGNRKGGEGRGNEKRREKEKVRAKGGGRKKVKGLASRLSEFGEGQGVFGERGKAGDNRVDEEVGAMEKEGEMGERGTGKRGEVGERVRGEKGRRDRRTSADSWGEGGGKP
jgi:hypothetical protein